MGGFNLLNKQRWKNSCDLLPMGLCVPSHNPAATAYAQNALYYVDSTGMKKARACMRGTTITTAEAWILQHRLPADK